MPLIDCLTKIDLPEGIKNYILSKKDMHVKNGLEESAAEKQAINDFKNETVNNLVDLHKQVGNNKFEKNATTIESANALDVRQQTGNGEGVGSGNAEPPIIAGKEENQTSGEEAKVTGVKRAITDNVRTQLSLPKVELPKMADDTENLHAAKERVDKGESNPLELVNRILVDKGGYRNENEVFDMQYYAHQLQAKETALRTQFAEAESGVEKANVLGQLEQLSDETDRQTEAAQTAGNKWHKVGMAMQPVIDTGFNPSRERAYIKDAYGGEIPKDVKEQLDKVTKERDEALNQKKIIEEKLKEKLAKEAVVKIQKEADRTKKRDETKEKLKEEEKKLLDEIKKSIKKDLGNINSGIPLPKETLETLGKLAVNYFKQGVITLEGLVDKIHSALKEDILVTKKEVRDFLAEYEPLTISRETDRLNRKAANIEEKITPPTVQTKGGKLAGVTEPTNFNKPTKPKLAFRNNTEWVKANQRVANAEFKIKQMKRKAFESEKNMFQRGLMWAGRLTRLSVLSGYNVLLKLAAAATVGGAGKRIPEQAIGKIWATAFKGVAEKAPIEGSLNANAEAKFYKEFFTPQKFVKNSWEILKTGSSDLSKRMGSADYEHVPGLYLPTDLHQIIKDPLKRATFEASFRNGMVWAEKNGLNIQDPLVIQSLETAAYKRANYEIFQESNSLSRKFQEMKAKLDKGGNVGSVGRFLVDFMIPVSTVPTNIVRRIVTTSPAGLLRGLEQTRQAYAKGIESLSTEQADKVMRQLKQGSLGTALWLTGWFASSHFGGLYSKYNPDKKRKEGELAHDEMEVNGNMLPKPVQHALPLEIIQFAATARHVYDNYKDNKSANYFNAIYNAGMGSIGALLEQIPVVETGVHVLGAFGNPYEAKKLEEDMKRRFEPQILRETGIIQKDEKGTGNGGGATGKFHTPKQPKNH